MATTRDALLENVRRYRERMKAQGFRQLSLWVPDTRSPEFAEECRRQSRLAARQDGESDILDFLDAAAGDIEGWEP
ncbi:MAG: antitoxin MazE family protein [Nitrospira sp.]|jgi:hypothetical protein|nr:antitoxin MazE family protein [Nitrospira sp.]